MQSITLDELLLQSDEELRQLVAAHKVVLTLNGRPIALLLGVEEANMADLLLAIRRARAQVALSKLQRAATDQGLDHLSLEEIEAEIAASRAGGRKDRAFRNSGE